MKHTLFTAIALLALTSFAQAEDTKKEGAVSAFNMPTASKDMNDFDPNTIEPSAGDAITPKAPKDVQNALSFEMPEPPMNSVKNSDM